MGAELLHGDRHMTKLIVASRNFANTPKNTVNLQFRHFQIKQTTFEMETKVFVCIKPCWLVADDVGDESTVSDLRI